jgi:hypothetical protein
MLLDREEDQPRAVVISVHDDREAVASGDLAGFRRVFYRCLSARSDALFELCDAVLCSERPVTSLVELSLQRSVIASASFELGDLKTTLKKIPGISPAFQAKVSERGRRRQSTRTVSYSRDEFNHILNTARHDIRRAAIRIRANRDMLARWRAGEIDGHDRWLDQRCQVLDMVDRHAEVPRRAGKPKVWVQELGSVTEHVTALHLGYEEAVAFVALLVGLTGENKDTIVSAPAMHHRPDGYDGPVGSVIVELDKPRRGAQRHMDVALLEVPAWVPVPQRDPAPDEVDLRTSFGVYLLLHELAAGARRIRGSTRLLAWWAAGGGGGVGRGLRTGVLDSDLVKRWAEKRDLVFDHVTPQDPRRGARADTNTPPGMQAVTLPRLRLTHAELHQRPVAHSEPTLANEYLLRNRGNITEYQQVVANVLEEQVTEAKTRAALRILSAEEIEQARTNPGAVAARHGLDATTLQRMIAGRLDTVAAACGDHHNSPYSRPGEPCQASFMLCLGCRNARALPHHLPVQVAVHDALETKRNEMSPLRWAQRFALPHAQLAELLDRAGPAAVQDARGQTTDDQQDLVERLLNRELDLS